MSIELDTISKTYPGRFSLTTPFRRSRDVCALADVSLTVPQGGCCVLIGPNGAGKTSLLKIVASLILPDRGTGRVAGFDLMFNHGISREADLIDLGVELGLVKKSGAFFSWGDTRLGQGRENAKQYLEHNPELAEEIEQQVRASAITTPGTAKDEPVPDAVS